LPDHRLARHEHARGEATLKVLLVAWYFPPSNTIAAVRVGKLAKYLVKAGHDIRILTAANVPYAQTLPVEVPEDRVYRSRWTDINVLPSRFKAKARRLLKCFLVGTAEQGGKAALSSPRARSAQYGGVASRLYQRLFNFPDMQIGWLPAARQTALDLLREWQPDVIFATAPPFTTLLIGYLVSKATGIPLIVEYRDRWSDDPYYPPPWWRRQLERWLEAKITHHARAITTVSEPWAATYRARYGKPVAVIYNGHDPADHSESAARAEPGGWPERNVLRIIHTGGIYRGRRDPGPLFDAIARHDDLKSRVRVVFYGLETDFVPSIARSYGVEQLIEIHGRVDHAESLRQQRLSDVLLLMQMDSPLEQGNVPGKFFEYLGARRPILVLGWDQGVPATIVKQRNAGAATTDPDAIARQLRVWIEAKERHGRVPDLSENVCAGFTHAEQAQRLAAFLHESLARQRL
jgi:glycosyltransferase involved in cell wall biosynthesis